MWFRKQGSRILAAGYDSCHVTFKGQAVYFFIYLCNSLSDSSLAITFATFLWQNVRVCHPNLANLFGALHTFLSQLRKMCILLISSYCKMFTSPTRRSRVFVCCEQYKNVRLYCWQYTHFTMGPNEQNQHFAEFRQNICIYIHVVVLLTCVPSLDEKIERFVTKKVAKVIAKLKSDRLLHK